jgi:DNA gyrase subunit B/topoisomerase-4 subunit B
MQGKPLNPLRATERRVGSHPLFLCLIDALGTGFGPAFDAAAIRFDRVLLLMDPDADGIHCGVLLAMFFHRWMRPLLDGGRIAIVRPPWGEVVGADAPLPHRAWSEQEFEALAGRLRSLGCVTARRYRGLAGIEAAVLRDTCVAPGSRRTERVTAAGVEAMIAVFQPSHGP